MRKYDITVIENYPDDGNHLECFIPLPFQIRRGEDGYYYYDKKGIERKYNLFKTENKVDDRWIAHIDGDALGANESLRRIFNIMVDKDLDKVVDYCIAIYEKSLELELKKVRELKVQLGTVPKKKEKKVIGVIAYNIEDFQRWSKSIKPNAKWIDTIRKFTYEGDTYVCLTTTQHPHGYSFDEIVETEQAYKNKDYGTIKDLAEKGLKIQKHDTANS